MTRMRRLPQLSALATTARMSHGARNCPFLRLTTAPVRAAAAIRSVWRESSAGICSTSTTSAAGASLRRFMDVGQHRQPGFALDPLQDVAAPLQTGPAKRGLAGAVGLVEGGFEDDRNVACARNRGQPLGMAEACLGAFDHARAGDQHQSAGRRKPPRPPLTSATAHEADLSSRTLASAPARSRRAARPPRG